MADPTIPLDPREAARERSRQYYLANKERIKAKVAQYQEENKERIKIAKKQAYQENKEQISERCRRYYQDNKDRVKKTVKAWKERNPDRRNLEQARLYSRQYRRDNPGKVRISWEKWSSENQEKRKEYKKRHYSENRERIREYYTSPEYRKRMKEYRLKNRELINASKKRYRATHKIELLIKTRREQARKKSRTVIGDEPAIAAFYKFVRNAERIKCHWCKQLVEKEHRTIDHIIPLIKGGLHAAINLCCACQHCNATKQARRPEEIAGQGFLAFS